ncbi:MAG: succinate dehydrogenase assembly factor 2 [Gammaproteobacteria bacterium]|nr:succinate dehydrogenase assembly factor 2 [Gammaproteobacteria bacterium]
MRPEVQKLLWRSRRGMLELDTLFRGYLLRHGEQMDAQQLAEFESLLELQDQTLFDAYAGKCELENHSHQLLMQSMMSAQDSSTR